MRKVYEDFIYLMRCTLNGESAKDFSGGDFGELFRIAQDHNMTNMLYYALRDNCSVPDEISQELQKYHDLMVYKCAYQKAAEQEMERLFNENEIRYMLLKGCTVRDLYPSEDMREMADIDILVSKQDLEKIRKFMIASGYEFKGDRDHHDVYIKNAFVSVEVHYTVPGCLNEYFASLSWSGAIRHGFKYSLDASENYIYLINHLHGHFIFGGIGVRSLLDIFLYEKEYVTDINWEYINLIFEEYGILDFVKNLRALNDAWFGQGRSDEMLDEMGEYVFKSGSYGRVTHAIMSYADGTESDVGVTLKALKKAIFLPVREMHNRMRILDKFPFLLPFGYLARLVSILFKQFRRLSGWTKSLRAVNAESVKKHKEMLGRFGIH